MRDFDHSSMDNFSESGIIFGIPPVQFRPQDFNGSRNDFPVDFDLYLLLYRDTVSLFLSFLTDLSLVFHFASALVTSGITSWYLQPI